MKAYKFVSSVHADAVAQGSVRVTPAHAFRIEDGHADGRSDPLELINIVEPPEGSITVSSAHPALPEDMFVLVKGGKRIHTDLVMSGRIEFIDNALLYCLSTRMDDEIFARMRATFGADAVFEISDVDQFGSIISAHSKLARKTFRSGIVSYVDRAPATTVDEIRPVDPFEKRAAFSWQSEFRLVWLGEVTSDAFQIDVPSVGPLLKRIA